MVLEHVPQDARALVERRAVADADRLGHRDLHVVDVAVVPHRLEDAVGEAQDEDVLDGLLAEVVIDPIDLLLGKHREQNAVELPPRLEVVPEGLLDDDAHPAFFDRREALRPEPADDRLVGVGRRREVEDAVGRSAPLLLDRLERDPQAAVEIGVAEIAGHVAYAVGKVARAALRRRRELAGASFEMLAEGVVGILGAADADDGEVRRDRPVPVQMRDGGREQPSREVARRAEDHEGGGRPDLLLAPGRRRRGAHAAASRSTEAASPVIAFSRSAPRQHPRRSPPARRQRLEVRVRLRGEHGRESPRPPRNGHVPGRLPGQLQESSAGGSALVELPGDVLAPGAEPERRGHAARLPDGEPEHFERPFDRRDAAAETPRSRDSRRSGSRRGAGKRRPRAPHRATEASAALPDRIRLMRARPSARSGSSNGLTASIRPATAAANCHRKISAPRSRGSFRTNPAMGWPCSTSVARRWSASRVRGVGQLEARKEAVRPVDLGTSERLAADRHDALAVLAGRRRDQGLDPGLERAERRRPAEGELVAASERLGSERGPEEQARVLGARRAAGFGHRAGALEHLSDVPARERGGDQAEVRERPEDRRRAGVGRQERPRRGASRPRSRGPTPAP